MCELVADSLEVEETVGHRLACRDEGLGATSADEVVPGLRIDGDEQADLFRLQDIPQALRVEALPFFGESLQPLRNYSASSPVHLIPVNACSDHRRPDLPPRPPRSTQGLPRRV